MPYQKARQNHAGINTKQKKTKYKQTTKQPVSKKGLDNIYNY